MQVTAQLNNLRISPRKVRAMTEVLRGLDVLRAKGQLTYTARRSAGPLLKLLDSALANAQNNFGLARENLYIKQVVVNEGVKLKRFRPKGFGMVSPLEKKTTHIRLILEERIPGKTIKKGNLTTEVATAELLLPSKAKSNSETAPKAEGVKDKIQPRHRDARQRDGESGVKKSGVISNIKRKFFRRKTI